MRPAKSVAADIDAFAPINGDWRTLDRLIDELWSVGVLEEHLPVLFGVFERHPTEDGAGVLWSIVHGVEALPFEYESALLSSLRRQVSFMGNVMLQRLEKCRAA